MELPRNSGNDWLVQDVPIILSDRVRLYIWQILSDDFSERANYFTPSISGYFSYWFAKSVINRLPDFESLLENFKNDKEKISFLIDTLKLDYNWYLQIDNLVQNKWNKAFYWSKGFAGEIKIMFFDSNTVRFINPWIFESHSYSLRLLKE